MTAYSEWTEANLLKLIADQVAEQSGFEYKRCGALRWGQGRSRDEIVEEISKDISAMANADGGVFVYGMIERDLLPRDLDDGFGPGDPTPEWLENVILSGIKPKPENLLVQPIELTGTRQGRRAYLVAIDRSVRGHQAKDGRYYRRRNFGNQVLEDWEVRELMNRPIHPALSFKLTSSPRGGPVAGPYEYELHAQLVNVGPVRVRDLRIEIDVPMEFRTQDPRHNPEVRIESVTCTLPSHAYSALRVIVSTREVLFPEQELVVVGSSSRRPLWFKIDPRLHALAHQQDVAVQWTVYADDMPPLRGFRLMRDLYRDPSVRYVT